MAAVSNPIYHSSSKKIYKLKFPDENMQTFASLKQKFLSLFLIPN